MLALILLVIATVLGIYKPFGMTPHGHRIAVAVRTTPPRARAQTVFSPSARGRLAWPYVAVAIAIIVLLVLLMHRAGMGMRH